MNLKRLINTFCQLNVTLPNEKLPAFSVCSSNVSIIKTPTDFYNMLKTLAESSTKRISISSLYIGTSHLEKELVSCFSEAKSKFENLDLTILLDYNRATRETITYENNNKNAVSSKSLLIPLVEQGANVNFYLTPKLSGFRQWIQRTPKWNELSSLHHMKLYIFDDNLIISGANLSDTYFTNRQDRYVLIRNSSQICDYFDQLIKTISKFSMALKRNGNFSLHSDWRYDPRKYSHQSKFETCANEQIKELNNRFYLENNANLEKAESVVFPLLQMRTIGIRDEEKFTSSLIKSCPENSTFNMATGYFNLTNAYQKIMLNRPNKYSISLLMASEEANGFYGGKGILQYIPLVYTYYVRNFMKSIYNDQKISLFYYCRPSWSFHGKGIWLSFDNCMLTVIGSTNFGYRSVYRDTEAQIVLLTKNKQLQRLFEDEYQSLVNDTRQIQNETKQLPKVAFWIQCVATIFRSYF